MPTEEEKELARGTTNKNNSNQNLTPLKESPSKRQQEISLEKEYILNLQQQIYFLGMKIYSKKTKIVELENRVLYLTLKFVVI